MLTIMFIIYTIIELYIVLKSWKSNKPIATQSIPIYLFFLAFMIVKKIFNLNMPNFSVILIIITLICHIFIGTFLDYYNKIKRYDRFLHAFGTFSFAIFSYCLILAFVNPAVTTKALAGIFVFTLGLSCGVFCEILEYISDRKNKRKNIQVEKLQSGLIDTDFDMIFDIVGSFVAAIFSMIYL